MKSYLLGLEVKNGVRGEIYAVWESTYVCEREQEIVT